MLDLIFFCILLFFILNKKRLNPVLFSSISQSSFRQSMHTVYIYNPQGYEYLVHGYISLVRCVSFLSYFHFNILFYIFLSSLFSTYSSCSVWEWTLLTTFLAPAKGKHGVNSCTLFFATFCIIVTSCSSIFIPASSLDLVEITQIFKSLGILSWKLEREKTEHQWSGNSGKPWKLG